MERFDARAEGIDRNGTNLTVLLRHLHERRRRRVLRRVARMLVELETVAPSRRGQASAARRIRLAGR